MADRCADNSEKTTHSRLHVIRDSARHKERDVVFALSFEDVIGRRDEVDVTVRDCQARLLEDLASGAGCGRLAKVEMASGQLEGAYFAAGQSAHGFRVTDA